MSDTAPEPLDPNFQIALAGGAFEGPLDLLLHLIRKHELDILDLPIAFVTERYLQYVSLMERLNLDVASEYLVMAATLAHIKSKMLLPQEPSDQDEEEPEEEVDPRAELIRRLLEYQKYKRAAEQLGSRGIAGRDVFGRGADAPQASGPPPLAQTGLFKLLDAFNKILARAKDEMAFEISAEGVSIQDRMRQLVDQMREHRELTFERLFEGQATVYDLVVTFLALLEMAKRRLVQIYQADPHSPLHLRSTVLSEQDEDGEEGADVWPPPDSSPSPPVSSARPPQRSASPAAAEVGAPPQAASDAGAPEAPSAIPLRRGPPGPTPPVRRSEGLRRGGRLSSPRLLGRRSEPTRLGDAAPPRLATRATIAVRTRHALGGPRRSAHAAGWVLVPRAELASEGAAEMGSGISGALPSVTEPDLEAALESASGTDFEAPLVSEPEPRFEGALEPESAPAPDFESVLESESEPDLEGALESESAPDFEAALVSESDASRHEEPVVFEVDAAPAAEAAAREDADRTPPPGPFFDGEAPSAMEEALLEEPGRSTAADDGALGFGEDSGGVDGDTLDADGAEPLDPESSSGMHTGPRTDEEDGT